MTVERLKTYAQLRADLEAQRAEVVRARAERDAALGPDAARIVDRLTADCATLLACTERAEQDKAELFQLLRHLVRNAPPAQPGTVFEWVLGESNRILAIEQHRERWQRRASERREHA